MAADDLEPPSGSGPTKQRVGPQAQQRVAREGPNKIQSEHVTLVLVEVDYQADEPPLDDGGDDPVAVDEVELVMVTLDYSEDPPSSDDPDDPDSLASVDSVELAALELDTSEDPPEQEA